MDLNGKVALVTGGGTGIGRAISLLLAERGADVAVNYSRSKAEAEATADEIRRKGRGAMAVCADVAFSDQVSQMVEEIVRSLGRLDVLVNNAACTEFIDHKDLQKVTDATWDRILAVNVKGAFNCIRAAEPHMRKAGAGAVVNVSSLAGSMGKGSSIPYCASKAALDMITRTTARALAPVIRVNGVAPGVVATRWVADQPVFVRGAQMKTPMRRIATPEDVGQAVLSLIADSDFITGQTLAVDGGLTA